ncbi:MAG TPA: cytochrome c biogenesis protein CcdA [Planctomycetota bacterium]|jgi:thiol:disulfide interchange protein DsbD|nr:cytochrome c biogenesis protein CcdA [Planctomycetota bacterium]
MKRAILIWLSLCLWLSGAASAQNRARGTLYARAEGTDVKVAIEIKIDRGLHLYHGPTVEEMSPDGALGKPTTADLGGEGFQWSAVRFPKAEFVEQKISDDETPTHIGEHHGTLVLYVRGRLAPGANLAALSADLSGSTCEDGAGGQCFPYDEKVTVAGRGSDALFQAFPADLVVPGDGAAVPTAGSTAAPTPAPTTTPVSAPTPAPPAKGDTGLWIFLLSAVGWGLFTLLMPCTYPMIPITISYFTKQATQRETGTLSLSLAYGAGIVLVFVLIGVLVGPIVIPFAAHPVTNIVIGGFFILFALSLFGVVDLQPPGFLLSLAGQASSKGGFLGVFLMGATLVVTSFTCTAPFVGSLLSTGASSGDLGRVALGMGVFGLTMAVPFMFLSMVPQKVKALPRSGEWMHTLKVTLGFVEIAAALKFISNVDLVWNWQFLSRELFLFLWMAIFAVAAIYLFGLIRLVGESIQEISPGRMVAGLFFALFAFYCAYGALGNRMDPLMTAIIPNYSGQIGGGSGHGGKVSAAAHTIIKDDYEGALAQAKQEGKLLLVNFTGFT